MEGVILMRDSQGEKIESGILPALKTKMGVENRPVVLQGELLLPIRGDVPQRKDGQIPHNYFVKRDPSITLLVDGVDMTPLSDTEFQLLEGIRSLSTRHVLFKEGRKLDWATSLKPDSVVYATIPGKNRAKSECTKAAIRYIGPVEGQRGIQFGIEILVSL